MYERCTDRARKVLQLANQEALRFNHEYIGTEHILLGLVAEGNGLAANVLKNLDIDLHKIRREVEKICQCGPDFFSMDSLPPTPRAEKVIEYAIEAARNLKHNYVCTEHLLLGLLRDEYTVAAQVLMNLGLKLEQVRREVLDLLGRNVDILAGGIAPSQLGRAKEPADELRDLPEAALKQIKELDAGIERLQQEKEDAVAETDFEKAARLRDQADKLVKKRAELIRESRNKS